MKTKKILVITHPGFLNSIKLIVNHITDFNIKVISFKDPLWKNKKLFYKINLIKQYDIVHFFWGYAKIFHFLAYKYISRTKIINHFMGTDLFNMINKSYLKRLELKFCSSIAKYIVVGKILKDDLKTLNINSEIVYIINHDLKKTKYTFPIERKAIAYIPSTRKKFFQQALLKQLAIDFPNVLFTWFPYQKELEENLPHNINCISYIKKQSVLSEMMKNKIFIRLPIHDGGAPLSLIEALSIGRWAIWSFNFRHVCTSNNYPELKTNFEKLINKEEANTKAENFVLEEFKMTHITNGFLKLYKNT